MEELTKEQRQIIEEEIKKEIKKADTFLKPKSINKIIQDIIGNIKGNFKYPKNLEEILSSIPQKVYVSLGKEEIKQILKLDFCCFVDNVFYIDFAPKIEPYKHNQNKTAIEEQRIIQCSYDDLLYLFKTYPLIFNHCIFDYKIDKKTPIEQIKKLSFLNCNFKKEIYLHFQECLDIFQMDNCVFEDRVTIKGKFNDNVYFNNSIFKNYADFHECEFEKTANFYGVRFEKAPNFSACYFKEPKAVNLTNVNIDKLDFKSLEQYIEDNYKDESYKNETKGIQDEKEIFKIQNEHQLRYAKNLKDSFRVIKDVLITQNNKLEAQEWHKLELYVKEKELEIQLGGDNKDSIRNNRKIKKLQIKKIIIKLIGMFSKFKHLGDIYIKICDFVVCFIMLIGRSIFGFLLSIIEIFCNVIKSIFKIIQIILSCIFCIASIDRILKLEYLKFYRKISSLGKAMLDFTLWFDCVLLQVYRNTSNHHTNFLKILNFTILMISLYAFMGFVFSKTINFISSFNSVSIIIANYFILFALIMVFFNVKRQLYQQGSILFFGIFGIFIILMMSFLLPVYIPTFCFLVYFASILFFYLLFLCEIKLFVFILRLVAYGCLIVVIILKPQLINPFVGIFSSDKLYESKFEKSLNDLNTSAIVNLASILQNDFNLHLKDQNISFTELNSAKALIMANKEKLKEILSKVYNDKYVSDYKKVLNELENNTSNVKNIIEEIDNKNNNSVVSAQLNKFLKLNFNQEIDILYAIKSNFSISEKLSPEQMALFDQKDSQDKLKSVLALLKFKSSFEGILKIINQDEITENTIKSTGVLYGIILLLCIFSLQKTARKNSIVPS
ncbi:pentapeptide repeat-containing protein [Campylobacter coli]|uniref:Pentapeptide repeat-containing protein n=1 Tax=Campylobacter coli TaxID=195 RepID=A0A626VER6_CAMCO|nr:MULTISPECIES: pentapeptide repeat-containing protein [Campylobacter]EAH6791891.1 pentapeptide repeat-containing protein [Campylobacter coli]EAH7222831.1 pentapeptide repeat-containing protein [Campylobacter coli]EAJ4252794.1 pentapeptide repeat-containing protein [Campylobacter coli]EAJ6029208.1 pentapeptide repeat-containing protein [Campylobacter coli]EAJ6511937.1 pentapeptide repeat-containing protein [Campylobacter coli]